MKIIDIPRSGSYADKTSSRNRGGQYVRNRRSPVQPLGTGRRALVRARLGSASAGWGALNDEQRELWRSYADANPYTDRLGQAIKLTGHQMFVAINASRANAGFAQSDMIPVSNAVPFLSAVSLSAVYSESTLGGAITSTGSALDRLLIATSGQVSAGRSRPTSWWQALSIAGNAAAYDLYPGYTPQFGELQQGKRIFVKITPVNQYGVAGAPTVLSTVVQG